MARIKLSVLRIIPTYSSDHKKFKPRSVFDIDFPEEMTPKEKKPFEDKISQDDRFYIVGYPYSNRQPEDADFPPAAMARIKLTVLRIVPMDSSDHKEFKPRSVFDIDFPKEMTPEEKKLFEDEISQNDLLYIVGYPYPNRYRQPEDAAPVAAENIVYHRPPTELNDLECALALYAGLLLGFCVVGPCLTRWF